MIGTPIVRENIWLNLNDISQHLSSQANLKPQSFENLLEHRNFDTGSPADKGYLVTLINCFFPTGIPSRTPYYKTGERDHREWKATNHFDVALCRTFEAIEEVFDQKSGVFDVNAICLPRGVPIPNPPKEGLENGFILEDESWLTEAGFGMRGFSIDSEASVDPETTRQVVEYVDMIGDPDKMPVWRLSVLRVSLPIQLIKTVSCEFW